MNHKSSHFCCWQVNLCGPQIVGGDNYYYLVFDQVSRWVALTVTHALHNAFISLGLDSMNLWVATSGPGAGPTMQCEGPTLQSRNSSQGKRKISAKVLDSKVEEEEAKTKSCHFERQPTKLVHLIIRKVGHLPSLRPLWHVLYYVWPQHPIKANVSWDGQVQSCNILLL